MAHKFNHYNSWLALQAGLLTPIVELCLRTAGLGTSQKFLRILARFWLPAHLFGRNPQDVQRLAQRIEFGTDRYTPYSPACLTRSLVLQFLLARRGIESTLCLGSKNDDGNFTAHAWVEIEGVALNEPEAPRAVYVAFAGYDKISG